MYMFSSSGPFTLRKLTFSSVLTAFATNVLPQPGGPYNSIPGNKKIYKDLSRLSPYAEKKDTDPPAAMRRKDSHSSQLLQLQRACRSRTPTVLFTTYLSNDGFLSPTSIGILPDLLREEFLNRYGYFIGNSIVFSSSFLSVSSPPMSSQYTLGMFGASKCWL